MSQLPLHPDIFNVEADYPDYTGSYRDKLIALLKDDLDFHQRSSSYSTHDLHAFPAKFPPQIPRKFIRVLTEEDDLICDPMSGSGTTLLEAYLAKRTAVVLDIDPLALLLAKVKITPMSTTHLSDVGGEILQKAANMVRENSSQLCKTLNERFNDKTRKFLDYWFSSQAQLELMALLCEIEAIQDNAIQQFMQITFSAIIITKSGGVSLARDLAHTRPHKVSDKRQRSPLDEFRKRLKRNLKSLAQLPNHSVKAHISEGNAQYIPLKDNTVDLIVTSPPYASNAIDYMRAHKFSLTWLGYPVESLSELRRDYIGGEATTGFDNETLPPFTQGIVDKVGNADAKKGKVLHRYYSEMTRTLHEIHRILKPGRAAVVVVGSSIMRGIDTQTHDCLRDIGNGIGFDVPHIGIRQLDRNRRMMPARKNNQRGSQIEERMHREYVIGFYKPDHHG